MRLLLATLSLSLFLAVPAQAALRGKLVSTGSDTLGALVSLWAQALMREHPELTVQVRAIGSSAAPTALLEGTADIGPMSRPMSDAERARFRARYGYAPTAIPVARDVLAVFVHRDNPLHSIDVRALDAVFSATRRCGAATPLRSWGELGLDQRWHRRPVARYGRTAASGTYGFFREQLLCGGDYAAGVNRLVGSAAVVRAVAGDIAGIGYASAGFLDSSVRRLRVLDSQGGERALSRELYLYVNRPPGAALPASVSAFVAQALSDDGQRLVRLSGYAALAAADLRRLRAGLGLGADP
jgi:phosphate transport system substrate-binding protein